MAIKRITVFTATLLFSLALVGGVRLASRPINRIFEPHLQRMLDVAAKRGASRWMKVLILVGADVNSKVYSQFVCINATEEDIAMDYHFPLHSAAWFGQTEAVKVLLGEGANVNGTDGFGRTAMWYTALGGHSNVTHLLLEKGADPGISNKPSSTSTSPLEKAAQEGETEIAEILLAYGAGQNGEMDSALWQAVWYDKPQTAKFLISKGANTSQMKHGMTLLERAFEHGDTELIDYLKQTGAK